MDQWAASVAANDSYGGTAVNLEKAERFLSEAVRQESKNCHQCVDLYFQAATSAWWLAQRQLERQGRMCSRPRQIYEHALEKLIVTGDRFGRLDPRSQLVINRGNRAISVPVVHRGFVHSPRDFDRVIPAKSRKQKELENIYRREGLGVSTVVEHFRKGDEPFSRDKTSFGATAILFPIDIGDGLGSQFVLELADPLRVDSMDVDGQSIPIVRDVSAAISYVLENSQSNPIQAFLHPGATNNVSKLFILEPYQPGKIPLVFVHGLLSDPYTWANMANEIMARPELFQRYQIWGFEYATGAPFLKSAADLRDQLLQIQATFDPTASDLALSRMVLVGHSMGGLISKLQITQSDDQLWSSVSRLPLPQLSTSEDFRARLARAFYFSPSTSISKVIYMGTPHRGSPWAQRPIGRLGAILVEASTSFEKEHKNLICHHPGNFSGEFQRRIPTSIDLLRTDSRLLRSIDKLCVANYVQEHSVIGDVRWMVGAGRSDGVVPVSSAFRNGATSELIVRSRHADIPVNKASVEELFRILWQHACETVPQ